MVIGGLTVRMKIALCGSGNGDNASLLEKAKQAGKEIAKAGHILIVGGCKGYPYAAERGALLEDGKVIVYSPAKDEAEHKEKYSFPMDEGAEYIFTGLGIPERNLPLIKGSDAIILIDGKIGTLNEFTIAFHEKKKIGVLKSAGITSLIPKIAEVCDKAGESKNIIYFDDVKEFLKKI